LNKRAIAIIVAGFLTVSIAYSIRYGYGMLLPEMLPELGISKTQAGVIFAVYFVVYTLFTPALGAISDLYNYRVILSVFTALLAVGALMMAYATTAFQASLFFALAGFGHAACWAPVVSLVQKWVPDKRRGTALSFVSMGVGSGIFIWGLLLPVIVSAADWKAGWIALGLTGLGIALLNAILIRNPINGKGDKTSTAPDLRTLLTSYRRIFNQGLFWAIGVAYLLIGANVIILFTFLPVYSRESLSVTYAASTRFISIIAFFGITGQLLLGPLSDKVGRIRIMITCSMIMGAASLGILLADSVWLLYLLTGCYGIGYGAVWPVYAAAASDLFPKRHSGGVVGLWTVFLGLGSIVAPVTCGWMVDQTGSYDWVFILALTAGSLSAFILLAISPKVTRQTLTVYES
jgi:MFS family permease